MQQVEKVSGWIYSFNLSQLKIYEQVKAAHRGNKSICMETSELIDAEQSLFVIELLIH
jgi:hypothetical protein